ncbi:MAG: Mut7-C RNAse domain-containing protein [Chloroflexi bacterium]|nr:Mut7-C RNAse domain-containing protein [Chloroflexota bacterium]
MKFLIDINVGKLARWLRMMGYDAALFNEQDDNDMVKQAMAEDRILLTRDTQIVRRRVAISGRLRLVLLRDDEPEKQLQQVIKELGLKQHLNPFTRCLECNHPLEPRSKDEVKSHVPPYVFKTQEQYMQCPSCGRIYWRGTHWQAMSRLLDKLRNEDP